MSVYFIQAAENGPVKIGVADDPVKRITALQTAHHENLRLIRLLDGDSELEKVLHRRFSDIHVRGEWFRFTPELLSDELGVDLPLPILSAVRENKYPDSAIGRWLFEKNIPRSAFAARIGISEGHLSRLISGERDPSGRLMFRIENETDRLVGLADFFEPVAAE